MNRRGFLRNASMTAVAGTVASGASLGAVSAVAAGIADQPNGKFDFDTVYNRWGTHSSKWDMQERNFGKGSLEVPMGVADMDFKVAPSITAALQDRLKHENWGYLDTEEYTGIIGALVVEWNKKRHGLTVDPKSLVFTTGVHPGVISALITLSPPGSKVLLNTPTYNGFYGDLRASRTIAEENVMKNVDGRYSLDFDDFERRITPDVQSFILCNPQNPTGNCWSAEDLTRLGEICLRKNVVVLADEIHCDFVAKGEKYTPFASLPNRAIVDNSITFKAVSKSFGLAAHKFAWFFSTNKTLLERVKKNVRADISTLGAVANWGALSGGEEWFNQCNEYIDGNQAFAVDYIAKNIPSIKTAKPQGTYLLWLDFTAFANKIDLKKLTAEANMARGSSEMVDLAPEAVLQRYIVKNAKVNLNPGNTYGKGGQNHMRMNLGTSRKLIKQALDNIAKVVNG
jgi:cystathionine beta-lyase